MCLAAAVAVFGHGAVGGLGLLLMPDGSSLPGLVTPSRNSSYYFFYVLGLCVTGGFSAVVLLWERRPSFKRRRLGYLAMWLLVLPMSMYNYAHFDFIIRPAFQAIVNLVVVFLGAVLTIETVRLRATAPDAKVIRALAIFLIAFLSVAVPGLFTILWLLTAVNFLSWQQANGIDLNAIGVLAAAISAAFTVQTYRRQMAAEPEGEPEIIIS